ncbi:MAG: 16S rRNA (cytosine(1402)-N(4))-methyltransferase RsmH [Gammaproteobacteria bacterium]|nr:16S rRNA (cytosine(1402)-N(4))-methyltransferase RsmH [Gammaproteobacteria bacterium]MDJ0891117.1 16S rRNA (cytosine(1402)-N(4))-methyltransferase RsmH [Gammaproteobacteria bacterium]
MEAHQPVLCEHVLDALGVKADGVYMDCTYGRGGHSLAVLQRMGPTGRVIGMDKDPEAVASGKNLAQRDARLHLHRGSFSGLAQVAIAEEVFGRVDGILFDLGVSSPQLDAPGRGFSFRRDGPLDMRMDPEAGPSAAEWLNSVRQADLARVLKVFGEERYAKRIAAAIVRARQAQPISTTRRLAEMVASAVPTRERDKDPATRTFQAVRIHINRELEDIREALDQVIDVLAVGGRLVVISFHSLEDRLIKRFMRDQARGDWLPRDVPVPDSALKPRLRIIGKPIRPSMAEVSRNPRARSAILRVAEKAA